MEHTHRAPVVDDDDQIVEVVQDCLESLGHKYDRAASQAEARELLAANPYCYVLLDLEIPVKPKRIPRIQSGENLLEEIRADERNAHVPIIVMTSHGTDAPDLAVEMMKKGANDYVCKPFPSGSSPRSLDAKIKEALDRDTGRYCRRWPISAKAAVAGGTVQPKDDAPLRPFQGGELVLHPDRVDLLGHQILRVRPRTIAYRILSMLAKRQDRKYLAHSGKTLAVKVDAANGQNAIAGCIRNLRRSIREAFEKEGYRYRRGDVIKSGGRGYRLNDWIVVKYAHQPPSS